MAKFTDAKIIDFIKAMQTFSKIDTQLRATILSGWPHKEYPNVDEAQAIESTFNETSLHHPEISEKERWYLAGMIVARIKLDKQ